METRVLTSSTDLQGYDAWVKGHPEGSLWQSLEWKQYQEALGREVRIYAMMEGDAIAASALVVIDTTSLGLTTWEIPRGPLISGKRKVENGKFLEKIVYDARQSKCLTIYFAPTSSLSTINFPLSTRFVHPEATRILDLTLRDEDLLNQMKPKGRYNIRLAEKHDVEVAKSEDMETYRALAEQTWARDGFRGPKRGYERFLKDLPGSFLLLATYEKKPVGGLLGVVWKDQGIYYYGASSNTHRELMAPYLLQWEAMRYCRSKGCTTYDLFGIAPEGSVNHPWAGVSDFKAKFCGTIVAYPPEQEALLRPAVKALLGWKRRRVW